MRNTIISGVTRGSTAFFHRTRAETEYEELKNINMQPQCSQPQFVTTRKREEQWQYEEGRVGGDWSACVTCRSDVGSVQVNHGHDSSR